MHDLRTLAAALLIAAACVDPPADSGAPPAPVPPSLDEAARALDGYLTAYRAVVAKSGPDPDFGEPDPDDWAAALAAGDADMIRAAHNTLDTLLGFDFQTPKVVHGLGCGDEIDPRLPGNVRTVHDPYIALELMDAARAGLGETIRTRKPEAIARQLRVFWARHPDYAPMHTGRCFRHGHEDNPFASPEECMVDGLTRVAGFVVRNTLEGRAPEPPAGEATPAGARACFCYLGPDCYGNDICLVDRCTPRGKYDGNCDPGGGGGGGGGGDGWPYYY